MVKKIDNHEIMTQYEAARLYRESDFIFIITDDENLSEDDIKGYVIYTYDKPWELDQIPNDELKDKHFGFFHGYSADYPQVGGVYLPV